MHAVLFDFDGTLLDSFDDIVDAMNHTLEAVGRSRLNERQLRSFIGDGLPHLVRLALDASGGGGNDPAQVEAFILAFKPWYASHWLERSGLYDGADELLRVLRSGGRGSETKVALISNKPEAACLGIVDALGITEAFDLVAGGDTYPERKPDKGPVVRALAALGVAAEDAVMVGDGTQDIRAGKAAGVRTIGVTWGLNDAATLRSAGADEVVEDMAALRRALIKA